VLGFQGDSLGREGGGKRLLGTRRVLEGSVYCKLYTSGKGGRLLDTRRLFESKRLLDHSRYLKSIFGSFSYCVVILRTTLHWSVSAKMMSCNFRLLT